MSAKKRQQTMAKLRREQSVRERRVKKQQKKEDARIAKAAGGAPEAETETDAETETEAEAGLS